MSEPLRRLGSMLGTPVFATATGAARAVLVSDLHLQTADDPAFVRLRGALQVARRQQAVAVLLGDVFDSFASPRQVTVGVWAAVAAALDGFTAAGGRLFVLHGNRDFLLGASFAAASGATVVPGALQIDLGGVPTLLAHGDEFCVRDVPYLRAKKLLRSRFVKWLSDTLPQRAALAIAERARARSRRSVPRGVMGGDQLRFLPTAAAVGSAFAFGARRVVFGHIHRHGRGELPGGSYAVLPAFDAAGVGFVVDAQALVSVQFTAEGLAEPTAEPGPCPFGPDLPA